MKRWTYNYRGAEVVAVECEKRGYPHPTETGETQYDNTHFDDELDAWKVLLRETEAGLSLDSRQRERLRQQLDEVTIELADDAERLVRVKAGLEECSVRQSSGGEAKPSDSK